MHQKSICCGSPGRNATKEEERPNKLSSFGQYPGQKKERGTRPGGTIISWDPAIRGIVPGDIPSSSHSGQQGHMVTVPSVRLPVHVPHLSIPGQQPGIGAANNMHVFDYQVPCMPVESIHIMSLSSNVSQNLKTKMISSAYVDLALLLENTSLEDTSERKNYFSEKGS